MNYHICALAAGFVIDLLIGDPSWLPHPIRGMGKTIGWCEKAARKWCGENTKKLLLAGMFLVLFNVFFWTGLSYIVCGLAYGLDWRAGIVLEAFLCSQLLATKGLKTESMKVYTALKQNDVEAARYAVSMIVGRDTAVLDEKGIIKATVETVAENLSDGSIAPMLFMAVGGAPLGYFYKVVNTMDSMIGYKDQKFLYLGRVAAKLDDVCNYLPSRISALLMIAASPLLKLNTAGGWKMWRRDHGNHASPNSAQTEATAAGLLNVQLAGDAYYFGKLYKKLTIGDDIRPIEKDDIRIINQLLYRTAELGIVVIVLLNMIIYLFRT